MKQKVIAIIPARMAASRFPGKPLANILGLPMIEHVRRRASLCEAIDEVYVATCDQAIMDVVTAAGGNAIMTKDTHLRCTDRVDEAMEHVKGDIVVILQGDEPLFENALIEQLVQPLLADASVVCSNLLTTIKDKADIQDVDIVKALVDAKNHVLYYSRAAVPHIRVAHNCPVYRQTGLSAFTIDFLKKFSKLKATPLEITESIDFMRILEHRFPIAAVISDQTSIGVDRPEDVALVEDVLKNNERQKAIYEKLLCLK